MSNAERKRQMDRERIAAKRRASGVQPRQEWLAANQISILKPWVAAGVSRSRWYLDRQTTKGKS